MIALEPEAAALFCTEKKLNEMGSVSVEGQLSQPNAHYMVVDIGGKCVVVWFSLSLPAIFRFVLFCCGIGGCS